jgi:hypothetical protein
LALGGLKEAMPRGTSEWRILLKKSSGQKAAMKNTTKSLQHDRESCV